MAYFSLGLTSSGRYLPQKSHPQHGEIINFSLADMLIGHSDEPLKLGE